MGERVGVGGGGAAEHAGVGHVVAEGAGADLDALVGRAEGVGVVAGGTGGVAGVVEVVLVAGGAV